MVLSLPFLPIDSWDDHVKVRKAVYGHEQIKKEMAKWGAQIYSTSYLPMYEVMGKGTPPRTVADWKALNVRAGGGIGEVLAKIGATPTSTTATEVYTGVQQGTMDAAASHSLMLTSLIEFTRSQIGLPQISRPEPLIVPLFYPRARMTNYLHNIRNYLNDLNPTSLNNNVLPTNK